MEVDSAPDDLATSQIELGSEFERFTNALDDILTTGLPDDEKRERLLALPDIYYNDSMKRLAQKRPRRQRSTHGDVDMDTDDMDQLSKPTATEEDIGKLEKEAQTWDLLRRVLPLRHPNPEQASRLSRLERLGNRSSTEDSLGTFFQTNNAAKERRAVLQWLQTNAQSGPDIDDLTRDLQQNADRGDIVAHGWLHTRSDIKMKKRVTGWPHLLDQQAVDISTTHKTSSGEPLVTQLDPDAASRQQRKLQPQDEYFERAIWRGCFEHVRRGSSLNTLRDWCAERTEMWRALSMSGMLLSADGEDDVAQDIEPYALALWRRMCYSLARQGGSDKYERAVYGVLAGDIQSVKEVSLSWDDLLFTHYNALLRSQIDSFILGRCPPEDASSLTQNFPTFNAIQHHGDDSSVAKRIIGELEKTPGLEEEAVEPSKALQAAIVAADIEEYLYHQGLSIAPREGKNQVPARLPKYFTTEQHDGLRIVSHVYVLVTLLKQLDPPTLSIAPVARAPERQAALENIVAQYTDLLRRAKMLDLTPIYCSILEAPRQYEVLSSNLISEGSMDRCRHLLTLIKGAGIDGPEFVLRQAAMLYDQIASVASKEFEAKSGFRILEAAPPGTGLGRVIKADFFGENPDDVDPKHEELIRSAEWLLLVDETWPQAFSFGTKLYKFFLRHMNLLAARKLMERMPFTAIVNEDDADEQQYDEIEYWIQRLEDSNLPDLDPVQLMQDARNYRELESLTKALDSLETIGSFAGLYEETSPGQRDYWSQVGESTKVVKDSMQPLLKNWLLAGIEDGDQELKDLRTAYLPEAFLAYVSALHFAGIGLSRDWLLECMNLAAVVAERDSDLERTFVESRRMRELVDMFAAASKTLAVSTGSQRAAGTTGKKLREMGWTRDLWSVKS